MANPRKPSYYCVHKTALSQSSYSSANKCDCPPEYYCEPLGEEGSYGISTHISWQHFPRSTSTRDTCLDDSSQEFLKKSSTTHSEEKEEKKTVEKKSSAESGLFEKPIVTKSIAQLNALHYLEIRHVYQLLNFLIGHLVCNEPDDPINFLVTLLDKCINFRDSFGEPPLLFTHSHISSLYSAFDPFSRGFVTSDQYKEAMDNLGIGNLNDEEFPFENEGQIEVKHFEFEAEKRMVESLRQMLRIPKPWQEDRVRWERKMSKTSRKQQSFIVKVENTSAETNDKKCSCSHLNIARSTGCQCTLRKVSPTIETEQLFFDYYNAKKNIS